MLFFGCLLVPFDEWRKRGTVSIFVTRVQRSPVSRRRRRKSSAPRWVVFTVVLVAAAISIYLSQQEDGSGTAGGPANPPAGGSPAATQKRLDGLEVSRSGSMSGYSREAFPHWSSADDFGWNPPQPSCNAREAALIRDGEAVEVGDGCKVESGTWLDPYTTNTYTDPSDIDTDHVVALGNAWRSGADEWTDDERERFANDPAVLLSVEDNANQSKGDKGPEAWLPPNEAELCDYTARWVGIKAKYDLTVNPDEKATLEDLLAGCGG